MYLQNFLAEALQEPAAAITYGVSRRLAEMFPDRAVVEGDDCDFGLSQYARAGLCRLRADADVHPQIATLWDAEKGIVETPRHGWFEVEWQGESLDVLLLTLPDCCFPNFWILAERADVARRFFAAVCAFEPEVEDEILVFEGGLWDGRPELLRGIRGVGFDGLVLAGSLKEDLRGDLRRFFASRGLYESLGAPWRRGLLLTGPPGNGKTHTIKALVNELDRPCLYVKSFRSERWTEERNIRNIFARARKAAPCVVVFEDLDALVTDENRSFFLNELDGFALNTGLVAIATTNHPEKLDPAIVERPSRFDRTFHFGLPGPAERRAYLDHWSRSAPDLLRLDHQALDRLADATDGFSFAYLKELVLASILALAASDVADPMSAVVLAQAEALQRQRAARAPSES